MAEPIDNLSNRLQKAVEPGFRERLLDKGLARGLIWQDGKLPKEAPAFPGSLTEDLLDYAYAVMSMAIRLRARGGTNEDKLPTLERAFLVAGEAIEAAVHRGTERPDKGYHQVNAASAFHLARYSARAYSVLPTGSETKNLSPTEATLVRLIRRKLDDMHASFSDWLLDVRNDDGNVANLLSNQENFDEDDATHIILTTSFMRGLALFDHAITTGEIKSATAAKEQLRITSETAGKLNVVNHWWTATVAGHLIDELWQLSMYMQLPILPNDDQESERWNNLRLCYIHRLRNYKRAAIEFWPSQLTAVHRAIDLKDNLVVALPTSAGKTRIAELCILRALAAEQRVVYVTPLRALSSQTERDLIEIFLPLGYPVSSLYGSAGIETEDAETLCFGEIVVSTPEKLDFALRNDASIIDDVGLIVLDEGHMLGPKEREVRYETLIQRLIQRKDSSDRRLVCLSALFPEPEEMNDFIDWIRQDIPGSPVYSTWRPTRQRFGVIHWLSTAARLDLQVEEEKPFVHRFVETIVPPEESRRQKNFPSNKNELTLAAAWHFAEQGKEVLVYCSLRKSVEKLGKILLKCIQHGVLQPLNTTNTRIQNAINTGIEWLGENHPAVQCLSYGVALHHGGLPRSFLNEIEHLLRNGECPITIASPTLAQGLNLSASVLLVPSIWRDKEIIPAYELANVAGRAGRAFVDMEGLVLHVVWEESPYKTNRAIHRWNNLVNKAKAPRIQSGILMLSINIYQRIARIIGIPIEELVDYITGNSDAWDFNKVAEKELNITAADWERDIASLDAAILALLNAETPEESIGIMLDEVLEGSLFFRQLERYEEVKQGLLRGFIAARAKYIWGLTQVSQRKGYHAAGVGLTAGQFIDTNLETLVSLLEQAETAIEMDDKETVAETVVKFADLVFQTAPFRTHKELHEDWKYALKAWMLGYPSSEMLNHLGDKGVDLLQDAFMYRLPWAMEAVRAHLSAVKGESAVNITGLAALAVEAGCSLYSVIVLLRNGLNSREAAITAVKSTSAKFKDRDGMLVWLNSREVQSLAKKANWPTEKSRHSWLRFYEDVDKGKQKKWKWSRQSVQVEWTNTVPEAMTHVVLESGIERKKGFVLTPDFMILGELKNNLNQPRKYITNSWVSNELGTVEVEYFGPIEEG